MKTDCCLDSNPKSKIGNPKSPGGSSQRFSQSGSSDPMIEIKSKTVVSHVEPSEIQNREVLPNVLACADKVIK